MEKHMEQSNNKQSTNEESLEIGNNVYMAFPKCAGITSISIPQSLSDELASSSNHSAVANPESVSHQASPGSEASNEALMWVATKGHTEIVEALEHANESSSSSNHLAVANLESVSHQASHSIEASNEALMWAAKKGHTEIVEALEYVNESSPFNLRG